MHSRSVRVKVIGFTGERWCASANGGQSGDGLLLAEACGTDVLRSTRGNLRLDESSISNPKVEVLNWTLCNWLQLWLGLIASLHRNGKSAAGGQSVLRHTA